MMIRPLPVRSLRATPFAVALWACLWCWSFFAQAQQSQWYRVAEPQYPTGGTATQLSSSGVYRDATGNLLYTLVFEDSVSFQGVHLVSSPTDDHYDFAVFKLSPSGQVLWHWQAGGSGGLRQFQSLVIATDSADNILLTGRLRGGALVAGGTTLLGTPITGELFLLKLSAAGQVQWAQLVVDALSTGSDAFTTNSLTVDHAGNTLITGYYDGDFTIGGQPVPAVGNNNAFLVKVAPNGAIVWVKSGSGGNSMEGNWVCVDADDNIYFSGDFIYFGTFDGVNVGVNSAYRNQCFLMKMSPTGQIFWTRHFNTPAAPGAWLDRLVMHPSGDLLLRLRASGTAFGVALSGNANVDMMRISPAGVARWVRPVPLQPAAIYNCDQTGNIYFVRYYNNTTQNPMPMLGNGVTLPPPPAGGGCGFVAAFDENLQAQWAAVAQFSLSGSLSGFAAVLPTGQVGVMGGYSQQAILGTDTLRVRPYSGTDRPAYNFVWSFNAPLGFGVAPEPLRLVCPGTSFRLPFIAQSGRFGAANVFRAELSDSTGYFGAPLIVGTLTGRGTGADSISITLPAVLPSGGKYQVRVVSTSPAMVSAGAGLALDVRPGAVARILAADTVGACAGQPLPLLRAQVSYGSQVQWLRNGQALPGATAAAWQPTQPGTYTVQAGGAFCGPATSRPVEVLTRPTPTLALAPLGQVLLTAAGFPLLGATPAGGTWSGPGVSGNAFSPSAAGLGTHLLTYAYTSRFGCAATTTGTIQVVRTLGVGAEAGVQALTLSPNPARGEARLTFGTARAQAARVALYDALGRLVSAQVLPVGTAHATTLALPPVAGVYQVRVELATGAVSRTLLVQP